MIQLVVVEGGELLVGEERRKETVRAFKIARAPVTWGELRPFLEATGRKLRRSLPWQPMGRAPAPAPETFDRLPVHNVTFEDAQAFCAWAGLRLPTELEWERAARGTDGRRFPWGEEPPTAERCVWRDSPAFKNARGLSTAPGPLDVWLPDGTPARPQGASPAGCIDIAGNVRAWCAGDVGGKRALRGGFFNSGVADLTTWARALAAPDDPWAAGGLRPAADA